MPSISVTDRDGSVHAVQLSEGESLMEVLRDKGLGVDGACGGAACCGSCHIYLDEAWVEKLPQECTEPLTLEGLIHSQPNSRLSCQLDTRAGIDGLKIQIAPEEI